MIAINGHIQIFLNRRENIEKKKQTLPEDFFVVQILIRPLIIELIPLIITIYIYLTYCFFKQYFAFFMYVPIRDTEILHCAGNIRNI